MNVDQILDTLNRHQVRYLLIGGMIFLLRHSGALTYDVDVWIDEMLKRQLALSQHERKSDRIAALESALKRHGDERRPEAK